MLIKKKKPSGELTINGCGCGCIVVAIVFVNVAVDGVVVVVVEVEMAMTSGEEMNHNSCDLLKVGSSDLCIYIFFSLSSCFSHTNY